MNAVVAGAGNTALTPTNMESAIQLAEMMARGKLVPSHLHNSPGDCLMVIEASMRWQMSPFAVAQCTSVIQGKLMFEGKLVAAALNASGILSSRLDYDFSGKDAQRAVTVRGTLRGETKAREVTVFLADAKTSNSMWTKQPDQQLVYAGTRVWARRHAPEVMLGVYAPEEFDRAEPFNGPTLEASPEREAINDDVSLKSAALDMKRAPRVTDKGAAEYEAPPKSTPATKPIVPRTGEQWNVWMDRFELACGDLDSRVELDDMVWKPAVVAAKKAMPPNVLRDFEAILAAAYERLPATPIEPDLSDEALGEVEVLGEEKVAAGD